MTLNRSLPKLSILVFDKFSPFHLSVPIMVFNGEVHEKQRFETIIVAGESGRITSEIGMEITPSAGLDALKDSDLIIVPYWRNRHEKPNQELLDTLLKAYDNGATIVGLCLGGYVLGYAGLLEHRSAAMHWEFEEHFSNSFPTMKMDNNALYVEDDRIITSAGIAANIDCCLYVLRKFYGSKLTNQIARRMVVPPHREGGQAQYIERPVPRDTSDSRINALLDKIRQDLTITYSIDELAESVLMTRRTFTRKFNNSTGMSVGKWLTTERLHQAQELLETSGLSIEMVSEKAGFSSVFVFRDQFKKAFSVTPKEWRKTFFFN
ncbi:GlxA family transcriptional regulator [Moritella sp. 28]|uniref:GlxA family transcriptional regulator n=1 Tax=Moritella sp. 28 TaxID=2746232 RepID=UPI001BAA30C4|nr:helix-turn-helix domain-containing protein [Moritella sp. 28]QUM83836.1 helix-turn-helix domain-containing protein [Moritella sp. 28]